MIAIQIGIIIFLIFILVIVSQDEYRKKIVSRKLARLNRFWHGGYTGKERRRSIRINTEIDVSYEAISAAQARRRSSMSRNISLGGINLALNEKLLPGTAIKLQFNLPENPRIMSIQGEVVWAKEISEKFTKDRHERFFSTGIKFTHISPENEAVLRKFIDQRKTDVPLP